MISRVMVCTVHRRHLHAQSIQKVWKDTRRAFYHHSSKATEQPTRSHHTKKLQSITPLATTTTNPYYKLTCLKTIINRNKPRYSFPSFSSPSPLFPSKPLPPPRILNAKKTYKKSTDLQSQQRPSKQHSSTKHTCSHSLCRTSRRRASRRTSSSDLGGHRSHRSRGGNARSKRYARGRSGVWESGAAVGACCCVGAGVENTEIVS